MMARVCVLVVILFGLSTCWTAPLVEKAVWLLRQNAALKTPKPYNFMRVILRRKTTEAPATEKTTPETTKTTPVSKGNPGPKVQVILAPTPYFTRISPRERRCCRIGRKAARKGYSCYVDTAIMERRLNMPHRYKMKFVAHGPKYGNGFANKLQFCGKDRKRQRIFYHCCGKDAAIMDF